MGLRRECRLLPAVLGFMYLALIAGAYLAPVPPGVKAAIAPDDVSIVYWDGYSLVAVKGSSTLVSVNGEALVLEGVVARAACSWSGYLAVTGSHGPYMLLAVLGPEGSWNAVETPGTPVALVCTGEGPLAASSLGPRLTVLSLEGLWLVRGAEDLLERRPGYVYVSVGAPILALGSGALLWSSEPIALTPSRGEWSIVGASATPWGLALYGSLGDDGVVAWLSGEAVAIDAGSYEEIEAVSGGQRPLAVVRVEGQVPLLVELSSPGGGAAHRYYPYAPMIYRGAFAGEGVAGFSEILVGVGSAAVAVESLGYAPLEDAGVVSRTNEASLYPLSWSYREEPVTVEYLGAPQEGPQPVYTGEALGLRVVEAGAERLSAAASAMVLGAAAATYIARHASKSCPYS